MKKGIKWIKQRLNSETDKQTQIKIQDTIQYFVVTFIISLAIFTKIGRNILIGFVFVAISVLGFLFAILLVRNVIQLVKVYFVESYQEAESDILDEEVPYFVEKSEDDTTHFEENGCESVYYLDANALIYLSGPLYAGFVVDAFAIKRIIPDWKENQKYNLITKKEDLEQVNEAEINEKEQIYPGYTEYIRRNLRVVHDVNGYENVIYLTHDQSKYENLSENGKDCKLI